MKELFREAWSWYRNFRFADPSASPLDLRIKAVNKVAEYYHATDQYGDILSHRRRVRLELAIIRAVT